MSTSGSLPTPEDNSDGETRTRTLQMAGTKSVTFCESDIPDPPAVSYAKSVEDLLDVWSDQSPRWSGTSPLRINEVPIPLVYWPDVYKYWKGSQWKGVKKTWFDWKVSILYDATSLNNANYIQILVGAMSRMPIDNFWARYSIPDAHGTLQHMKYTPLLKQLAKERKVENEKLADLARHELTTEQLTYRKGAQLFVMTKPAMIAAQYRKLRGLEDEDLGDGDEDD